jgi:pimeloyl-ACP methyl ester carboxylesterase
MARITPPFHPIIYLRGYAMTRGEIEATTATPYMGFNLGATKVRQEWDRTVVRHVFESPVIRLMKDFGYADTYRDGAEIEDALPARSLIIHRYYDEADRDFGSGDVPSIEAAARELSDLILKVREQVCTPDIENPEDFRVHLVAHSMGGLICRCLLQNDAIGSPGAKALVDKVFTYGTPHNGIEIRGVNVPRMLGIWDVNNFNRANMAKFLGLASGASRVDSLNGRFPEERFFCLVGTNHEDYGLARFAVGPMSDGLVRIENATVRGAPRAFVHKSRSGPFGLVNSEEGYQNLVRFLFGDTFLSGLLEVGNLPLPPTVEQAHAADRKVRASYYFECSVEVRGIYDCKLSERTYDTGSAIFRSYDELCKPEAVGAAEARSPVLFSIFLDSGKVTHGRTMVLAVDLAVRSTEYRIDGRLFIDRRIPAENLYRQHVTLRITPQPDGWNIRYVLSDEQWGENRGTSVQLDEEGEYIQLESTKGFRGKFRLQLRNWNRG